MRTRSKPSSKVTREDTISGSALPPSDQNPGKLFVLPNGLSQEARLLNLQNPASGRPIRYLYCPENGFFEFTNIAATSSSPKSWLVIKDRTEAKGAEDVPESAVQPSNDREPNQDDYVTSNGDLLIATPYEALFFLLPALHQKSKLQEKLYLSLDDYVDELGSNSKTLSMSLGSARVRNTLEERLRAVCDTIDTGEEQMYRLSRPKLVRELVRRAKNMSEGNLPTSMENRFVREALESPITNLSSNENKAKDIEKRDETGDSEKPAEINDQLPQFASTVDENLASLLRLRVSFSFMVKSYLQVELRHQMENLLGTNEYVDFSRLDQHMERVASIRSEAMALRALSDNISRKRGVNDDEEAVEARAEKKRKQEEEARSKKSESRAAKDLKKVDTSGMKKLSSFFGKAAPRKTSTK